MQINKQVNGSLTNHKGFWRIVISYYDENNKRRQKTFSTGLEAPKNKRKAEQLLQDKLLEFSNNLPVMQKDSSKITASEWIREVLDKHSNEIRDTSMETYNHNYKRYIKDYFSNIPLRDIRPQHLDEYYKILSKKLSTNSMCSINTILNKAFTEAEMLELISKNPLKCIKKSKGAIPRGQVKRVLSLDEVKEILDIIKDETIYPIVMMTVTYGLRRGEVLGLTWDDIDFENRTISINKIIVNVNGGTTLKEYCKTDSSVRICTMTDAIYDLLKNELRTQEMNRMIYKDEYIENDYDLVFTCQNGKMRSPRGLSSSYAYILRKHNIPATRFHDLRHTAATLMFKHGASASVVQHALGHSSINTTMNVYVHNTDTTNKQAAQIMGDLLR